MSKPVIRLATRKSMLALWQAEFVKTKLEAAWPGILVEIIGITTLGDTILNMPLQKVGGKGLFVKELEDALLNDKADIAVHSMKDVPAESREGLKIAAILKRSDARDVFISPYKTLQALPRGARVGTSSLRRQSQLLALRSDLNCIPLRGNIDTRLAKLDSQAFDAIILAAAGLERLNQLDRVAEFLSPKVFLPCVGQGALGVECRSDSEVEKYLACLNHPVTAACVSAERSLNAVLGGNCQLPVGGLASIEHSKMRLQGMVGTADGQRILKASIIGSPKQGLLLGKKVALQLYKLGAGEIIEATAGNNLKNNH